MTRETLGSKFETSISSFKQIEEEITAMASSNTSGGLKLPLVIIGRSFSVFIRNSSQKKTLYLVSMKLPIKAALLDENCSSHPRELEMEDINVSVSPPNTTALIQPINGESLVKVVNQINLKNAIEWTAISWDRDKSSTITESWNSLWPRNYVTAASQNPVVESLNSSEDTALSQLFPDSLGSLKSYAPVLYHSVEE
ncbi:hypothetical protein PV326_001394 [Microctonus aethiopoides]|nr:hypothetical protein PV326_001394 [Microctonus aethiopoides]